MKESSWVPLSVIYCFLVTVFFSRLQYFDRFIELRQYSRRNYPLYVIYVLFSTPCEMNDVSYRYHIAWYWLLDWLIDYIYRGARSSCLPMRRCVEVSRITHWSFLWNLEWWFVEWISRAGCQMIVTHHKHDNTAKEKKTDTAYWKYLQNVTLYMQLSTQCATLDHRNWFDTVELCVTCRVLLSVSVCIAHSMGFSFGLKRICFSIQKNKKDYVVFEVNFITYQPA